MALLGSKIDGREVRVYENADELSSNLAEYIAELSEVSIKERGVFAIALSGGSLITLIRYIRAFVSCILLPCRYRCNIKSGGIW